MENNYKIQKMNAAIKSLEDNDKKRVETIQKINTELEGFESERKSYLVTMLLLEPVYLLLCLGFGYLVFYLYQHNKTDILPALGGFLCGAISFFSLGFFLLSPSSYDKAFKNKLKESECIKSIYNLLNIQKIDVNKDDSWQELLVSSKLFAKFNETVFDDGFKGSIDGVNYIISECELINHTNKGKKNESTTTVFKGLVVSFDSNKQINADTIIKSKKDENINNTFLTSNKIILLLLAFVLINVLVFSFFTFGILSSGFFSLGAFSSSLLNFIVPCAIPIILLIIAIVFSKNNKMQKVKLEDWKFDKRFDVLSTNQVEARYLITPSFMERLKSLETAFGTKNLKCSFFKDKIMFAISTDVDLFEFGSMYHSMNNSKEAETTYNQIKSIQNMIKHFKLSEKTGL